jgi:hypothetical protein
MILQGMGAYLDTALPHLLGFFGKPELGDPLPHPAEGFETGSPPFFVS